MKKPDIEEVLKGCGVFNTKKSEKVFCSQCKSEGGPEWEYCDCEHEECKGQYDFHYEFAFPTADESEALLGEMKLQVSQVGMYYQLTPFLERDNEYEEYLQCWDEEPIVFKEIPQGQRTWANNAGLAHMVKTDLEKVRGAL